MFVRKTSRASRSLRAALALAGGLLLCCWAGPALAASQATDFRPAELAAQAYCQRDTPFARGALAGCRSGLARAQSQLSLPQNFSSEAACRQAEQNFAEAVSGHIGVQRNWCQETWPDLLQQRSCIEAGRIYLTSLSQGFCPRSVQVVTPLPPEAVPPLYLPAQVFDTPKPGRWPGSAVTPAVPTRPVAPAVSPAPATAVQPVQPVQPIQPVQPTGPLRPSEPALPVDPAGPAGPAGQVGQTGQTGQVGPAASLSAQAPAQPGGSAGIPLQVTIPPPGSAPAAAGVLSDPAAQSASQSTSQSASQPAGGSARPNPPALGGSAPPAVSQPVTLPASALYRSGSPAASSANSAAAPAASAGGTSTPAGGQNQPNSQPGQTGPASPLSPVSQASPNSQPPATGVPSGSSGNSAVSTAGPAGPAGQTAVAQPAGSQASTSQASAGQRPALAQAPTAPPNLAGPSTVSEVAPLNFGELLPARPTPAPITEPAVRPPAPSQRLVETVMPGALPELEPFDENSPEARNFDPGQALGLRDDSTTPLQRFGDAIPNFTRDEMTDRQQENQQAFTYNRGPAGQMGD